MFETSEELSVSWPVCKRKQIGSLKDLKTLHLATTRNDKTLHSPDLP